MGALETNERRALDALKGAQRKAAELVSESKDCLPGSKCQAAEGFQLAFFSSVSSIFLQRISI